MTFRNIIVLGVLLTTQSAFAIRDGIYRAEQGNVVLEAEVWKQKDDSGWMQFIRVRKTLPLNKETPRKYVLVEKGLRHSSFEYGVLVPLSGRPRDSADFVTYEEPLSMKILLSLKRQNDEEVVFSFVREFNQD